MRINSRTSSAMKPPNNQEKSKRDRDKHLAPKIKRRHNGEATTIVVGADAGMEEDRPRDFKKLKDEAPSKPV